MYLRKKTNYFFIDSKFTKLQQRTQGILDEDIDSKIKSFIQKLIQPLVFSIRGFSWSESCLIAGQDATASILCSSFILLFAKLRNLRINQVSHFSQKQKHNCLL